MNKVVFLILSLFILSNCSLKEKSSLWNKDEKTENQKNLRDQEKIKEVKRDEVGVDMVHKIENQLIQQILIMEMYMHQIIVYLLHQIIVICVVKVVGHKDVHLNQNVNKIKVFK